MSAGRREQGTTLVEVAVYGALFGVLALGFFSALSVVLKLERDTLAAGTAEAEAGRLYQLVAADLFTASLATVSSPAPDDAAATLTFRRVVGLETDPLSGVPRAVVEPEPATLAWEGTVLTRTQAGRRVVLSPCVTGFWVARDGTSGAFLVVVEVTLPGGADEPLERRRARVEGQALVVSD